MVSAATRALVPRWWLGDRRVLVLPNALVLGSYARDAVERPRRRFDPADIVLLNVGRLSAEKGQDLLLRALARLAPDYPGLKLRFAGIGPLEGDLRELAAALGIAGRVSFLGYVTDMPALYGECDLLVQSSLTEGMPNVILEAAYLRMPMVATAVGGTAEVVRDGHSARLIRPGSVDEIAAGIRAFLEAPGDFAAMAARGHEDVREKFSFTLRTAASHRVLRAAVRRSDAMKRRGDCTNRARAGNRKDPVASTRIYYLWLLVALFVEYARPASYFSFLAIPLLYSVIPLLLLVVSFFVKGLRPFPEFFHDRRGKWMFILLGLIIFSAVHADVTLYTFNTFKAVAGYIILAVLVFRIASTEARVRGVFAVLLVAHLFLLAMNPAVVTNPGGAHLHHGRDFSRRWQ